MYWQHCKFSSSVPVVTLTSFSPPHSFKTLSPPIFKHQFSPNSSSPRPLLPLNSHFAVLPQIRCSAIGGDGTGNWDKWLPKNIFSPEKIFRAVSSATSCPVFQFISSPSTFLHSVDPRIKLVWLVTLVIIPARSNMLMRFGVVIYLTLISMWVQPTEVWVDQLRRVSLLSGIIFLFSALGTDGSPPLVQPRTPPPSITGLRNISASLSGYSYLIMKLGPLQLTRKGLSTASTVACLTFSIFQSASLCLTTTTPEQLAFALRWFILPLAYLGVPVAEVIFTLLLSLSFINLVFDEARNIALGIVSRRINWQQLTTMETVDIFFKYIRRIYKNIFSHAEQIAQAMIVRGFRGDSKAHKIYLPMDSSDGMANIASVLFLVCLVGAVFCSENSLV